jgi:hypothetical protein
MTETIPFDPTELIPVNPALPPEVIMPPVTPPTPEQISSINDPSALLPFVQYDPADGRIVSRGYMQKTVVESMLDQYYVVGVGDPELQYVRLDDRVIADRQLIEFDVTDASVPAGTPVTMTGLPVGTVVYLNDESVGVSEGECEFTPQEPGTYRFKFRAPDPRWRTTTLTITATDTAP